MGTTVLHKILPQAQGWALVPKYVRKPCIITGAMQKVTGGNRGTERQWTKRRREGVGWKLLLHFKSLPRCLSSRNSQRTTSYRYPSTSPSLRMKYNVIVKATICVTTIQSVAFGYADRGSR
ncbi:hypothetical protein M404DRAFT_813374 [Pisolithus tinctorius Marx 270]|uniref:Uncharacterized protein n=1 Tax=Pisolithus tinctorius Marx 270 TaxID=870435 RepID=A0A0C3JPI8_PISTI|nr:hypothetical protein M404DRAFT_813374 [Pisolithus tinctorius Marx 270]